jgi:hypothetical protein
MSFILYVVVLVVSVTSVMMGLDWLSTPPPPIPESVQTVRTPAKPVSPVKETASARTESAKSEPTQTAATTGAASPATVAKVDAVKQSDGATSAPAGAAGNPQANEPDRTLSITTNDGDVRGTDAQANAPVPRCDVQACAQRYRSFDASDCTFQPFDGPRRLCTVGNPPRQAGDTRADVQASDANKPSASPSCNYDACADAYRSFDPATCTWQPFEGPRRLCTK